VARAAEPLKMLNSLTVSCALAAWSLTTAAALGAPRPPPPLGCTAGLMATLSAPRTAEWKIVRSDEATFHYIDTKNLFRTCVDVDHPDAVVISELVDNKADKTERGHAESSITHYAFDCSAGFGKRLQRAYFAAHMGLGPGVGAPRDVGRDPERSDGDWRKVAADSEAGFLMALACGKVPPRRP
jgi:hypothetical protein